MVSRALIRILGFAAGILIAGLLYYWLWTESGPYAWIGGVLVAALGSLGARWTFISVFVIWLVFAIFAASFTADRLKKLAGTDDKSDDAGSAGVIEGMLMVPLAVLLISLVGTVGGILHRKPEVISASAMVRGAGWMPRNVRLEGDLALDVAGAAQARSTTSHTTDVFLPVKTDGYDPKAPGVFVRISNVDLKDAQWTAKPLEGTLAREPLPTLARRSSKSGGAHAPTFAIVFEHQRGVFGYWFGILLAHLVPFGVYALNRLYWAPKEKATKAAEAKEAQPPVL